MGTRADGGIPAVGWPSARRRSGPHLAVGALLVVVCALGFALIAGHTDGRRTVLALAHAVTVGHRLAATDLTTVRVSAGPGLPVIPARSESDVVGQTIAVSLPAGSLLSRAVLGASALPAGQAVVAVSVQPGQAPPDLAAGQQVTLVEVAASSGADPASNDAATPDSEASTTWTGVVTAVEDVPDSQGSQVVAVQLPVAAARQVAALPAGRVDVVVVSGL